MEMKLWLLRPRDDAPGKPWEPWYDKAFGFVVAAETESGARHYANAESGDEKRDCPQAWLDSRFSSCTELSPDTESGGAVLRDFRAA